MKKTGRSPGNVDDYIAGFAPEVREILEGLRTTISNAAPEAHETIKYGIPTFVLNENLVHFAAFKNHIGFYPTPSAVERFEGELAPYKHAKGSVQFPMDEPVPLDLVRTIVAFRVGEARRTPTHHRGDSLLDTLQHRFQKNARRHEGIAWTDVQARIEGHPDALAVLHEMEATGGEPDVIGQDDKTGRLTFCDCSAESPSGRRSLCYDPEALDARKEHKPRGSAVEMAESMGIDLLTEDEYRELQTFGEFDVKTSSWICTPPDVRSLGGALFCDRRFGRVFVYHNGAQSYYASRGFRGRLRV